MVSPTLSGTNSASADDVGYVVVYYKRDGTEYVSRRRIVSLEVSLEAVVTALETTSWETEFDRKERIDNERRKLLSFHPIKPHMRGRQFPRRRQTIPRRKMENYHARHKR